MSTTTFRLVVVLVVTAAAAVTDARWGRIPNRLSYSLLFGALLGRLFWGDAGAFLAALAGAAVGGAVPVFLFCRGAMGGGDVKLFAGIGAALGARGGLEVQIVAYVAAALYSLVVLVRSGELKRVLGAAARLVLRVPSERFVGSGYAPRAEARTVRLGVFIFVACVVCIGQGAPGFS